MATNSDIARHLGRKPSQVTRWVKMGMPTVSLDAAARWVAANVRSRLPSKPAPEAAAGDPAAPADESEPGLRRRLLAAQVAQAEHKARTGTATRVSTRSLERAFFRYHTLGRATLDALHPRLLDRLDEFCPETDPRYGPLYTDIFRMCRESWGAAWSELAQAVAAEHPQWGRRWFVEFAAAESRPGSVARVELERMNAADAQADGKA